MIRQLFSFNKTNLKINKMLHSDSSSSLFLIPSTWGLGGEIGEKYLKPSIPNIQVYQYTTNFYGYQHTFLFSFIFLIFFFIFLSFIIELKPSAFILKTFHSFIIVFLTLILCLNVKSGYLLFHPEWTYISNYEHLSPIWPLHLIENIYFYYGLFETFSYCFLILLIIFIMIFCLDPFFSQENDRIEFSTMILLIGLSGGILLLSREFIEMFILLECISLASYVLVGFEKHRKMTATIAIQYLILSSIPAAFFILGLALIYKEWGTLQGIELSILGSYAGSLGQYTNDTWHLYNQKEYWSFWWLFTEYYFENSIYNYSWIINDSILFPITSTKYEDIWFFLNYYIELDTFSTIEENIPLYEMYSSYLTFKNDGIAFMFYNSISNLKYNQLISDFYYNQFYNYITDITYPYFYLTKILNKNLIFSIILFIGIGFLLINLFFKLTAAPFHIWAPTIYQNTPVTAVVFLTIFVKAVIFLFLLTLFTDIFYEFYELWGTLFIFISIFSMIIGILGAFIEKAIKKFIIYSSISHAGFILLALPFIWFGEGQFSYIEYLIVYSISSLILWGGLLISLPYSLTYLTTLKKILLNNLLLLFLMSLNLFSMGGIPPLAGFFIKFDIIYCVLQSSFFYLGFLVFILTIISFFYYLRFIKIMFFENFNWMYINKYPRISKAFIVALLIHFILFITLLVEYPLYYLIKECIDYWFSTITQ